MDNPIAHVTVAELVGEEMNVTTNHPNVTTNPGFEAIEYALPIVCFIDKKPCIKNCAIYDKNLKQCAGLSIMKALDRIANSFNKEKWV